MPQKGLPPDDALARASGLLILGGPMGVYERQLHSWIDRELASIRAALARNKPVLGICLGSQMLAAALHARVYPHTRKEIGWADIHFHPAARNDPLFSDAPSPLGVFHWHGDTFDLPDGAVLLASSEVCPHQIYRHGTNAWGLQCHLEIEREDPACWAAVYADELERTGGPTVGGAMADETSARWPALRPFAEKAAGRFLELCLSS